MSSAEPSPSQTVRTVQTRSPFVRLTELLGDMKPGQPPINLTVGEPQHPIPPFVGSVIEASLKDFGRYPPTKGNERFRRAAASWLDRRFALPRSVDPENEVLVVNGTREALFLAALAGRELSTKQSLCCCRRPARAAFFPISIRSTTICCRARSQFISARRAIRRVQSLT
jgi:hypothetical protein